MLEVPKALIQCYEIPSKNFQRFKFTVEGICKRLSVIVKKSKFSFIIPDAVLLLYRTFSSKPPRVRVVEREVCDPAEILGCLFRILIKIIAYPDRKLNIY